VPTDRTDLSEVFLCRLNNYREEIMKTVCAWCDRIVTASAGADDGMASHGICEECWDRFFPNMGTPAFREYVDNLTAPVLVVDNSAGIVLANGKACSLLAKKPSEIEGKRCGEAIECPLAELAGGCGKTRQCKACIFRQTVLDTYVSTRSHYDIPADIVISTVAGVKNLHYLISTQRACDFVFLKITDAMDGESDKP
jgi:PAS domain-containing protein